MTPSPDRRASTGGDGVDVTVRDVVILIVFGLIGLSVYLLIVFGLGRWLKKGK